MELRNYQKKIIKRTKEFIDSDEKELVIELYTGLGKTYMIPYIANELVSSGYQVYIVSDISQLINQLKEHFKNQSLKVSILNDNEQTDKNSPIILSTDQTLYNRLKNNKLEPTNEISKKIKELADVAFINGDIDSLHEALVIIKNRYDELISK